ncbi:uncharacterized protein LOC134657123 [Cydia amplana]|uniref:uncharacterized protein LOC134657123 n=1 Tax=Cydia amplana TaxID=1869771 RepID=UPI002FE60934
MLSGDIEGSIKTLKAKRPDGSNLLLPSQWALGPEGTPQWPNGNIQVYIDSDSYGEGIAGRVLETLHKFHGHDGPLCPQIQVLKEKPTEPVGSWLHVTNPDRVRPCVHDSGVADNGEIKIVLGYDCLRPREILHTILHGLGFRDEVTHPQRDLFVRVMWENIQPAFRSMFRIQSVETNDASLMEYDPLSVMHFHDRAYSLNGQPTIMPMLPGLQVEPSDELSHLDKMKIKRMFSHECKKRLIDNVIHRTCASFDELKGEVTPNNGNGCPPVNGNGDHGIVIPGNDVKLDDDDQDAIGNDVSDQTGTNFEVGDGDSGNVIIPGNDVNDGNGIPGNDVNGGNVVIPGNDVNSGNSIPGNDVNGGNVVIPGNDVKVGDSGVSDNDAGDGNNVLVGDANEAVSDFDMSLEPQTRKPVTTKLSNIYNIPDDEAIVVGYGPGT